MRNAALAAVLALLAGQTAGQDYAGTWVAELAGTTYARLELSVAAGTLAGGLGLGDIHLDADGVVATAEPVRPELLPLFAIDLRSTGLFFSRTNDDEEERFELRLLADGAAELVFLPTPRELEQLTDNGVAAPKPFRMRKVVR